MPIDDEGNITPGDDGLVMTARGPRAADPWEMPQRRRNIKELAQLVEEVFGECPLTPEEMKELEE